MAAGSGDKDSFCWEIIRKHIVDDRGNGNIVVENE